MKNEHGNKQNQQSREFNTNQHEAKHAGKQPQQHQQRQQQKQEHKQANQFGAQNKNKK